MPRNPWSARGMPLVRRSQDALSPDALDGMPGRVRECLLQPPQPDTLHVAQAGAREGRQLQRARITHRLEPWEDLIAVWQWARVFGLNATAPSSLIFTTQGIRIAEPRLRLSIAYCAFREHTFSYEFTPGGRTGPDMCELVIAGPTSWRSPNSDQSAELIAADLTSIRDLTSLAT
jgi:hypothetical protein